MTHEELAVLLDQHIERDREEHNALVAGLDAHVADSPDEKDHAALHMLLTAHMERTEAGHARLLLAFSRHIEAAS